MAKTVFTSGTVVTPDFLNRIFVTGGGHVHDGGSADNGSAPKINLASHVTSMLPMSMYEQYVNGFIQGVTLAINAVDAYDVDVGTGRCADSTGLVMFIAPTITKRLDATWAAGNNQGGRASGVSLTGGTEYGVFAIYNPASGVADVGFDTSETAANLLAGASGFTKYRKIGLVCYADGTNKITACCYMCGVDGSRWLGVARVITEDTYATEVGTMIIVERSGYTVTLYIPTISGTSDSTSFKIAPLGSSKAWPSIILPSYPKNVLVTCCDGGNLYKRPAQIETPSNATGLFNVSCMARDSSATHIFDSAGWVNTGTKRLYDADITYSVY